MARVAESLGIGSPETVRKWWPGAEIDAGKRAGTTSRETADIKRFEAGERRAAPGLRTPS